MKDRRHARAVAAKLMRRLPSLPQPWDIWALCRALERQRGRSLALAPVNIPEAPTGMWLAGEISDTILYQASLTGPHRDHIILHEICHIVAGHGISMDDLAQGRNRAGLSEWTSGSVFSSFEEEVAEMFATMILKRSRRLASARTSATELRVGQLLGAFHA